MRQNAATNTLWESSQAAGIREMLSPSELMLQQRLMSSVSGFDYFSQRGTQYLRGQPHPTSIDFLSSPFHGSAGQTLDHLNLLQANERARAASLQSMLQRRGLSSQPSLGQVFLPGQPQMPHFATGVLNAGQHLPTRASHEATFVSDRRAASSPPEPGGVGQQQSFPSRRGQEPSGRSFSSSESNAASVAFDFEAGAPDRILPYSQRHVASLGIDQDVNWLSEFQDLVRNQFLEYFQATSTDVSIRTTSKSIQLNQCGIRCRFCAHVPAGSRASRSSAFPSSTAKLYQSFTSKFCQISSLKISWIPFVLNTF